MGFIAESSLSLLFGGQAKRLRRHGFDALLPEIESWHDPSNKSNGGVRTGGDKRRPVAEGS